MNDRLSRRRLLGIGGSAAALGLAGCLGSTDGLGAADDPGSGTDEPDAAIPAASVHQLNAPGCSCCGAYGDYLREAVTGEVTATVPDDLDAVKREHGVPDDLRSCHTVLVDGYVVEGHVPASAVATLLDERPPIDGIALPGMPAGSPGMPGERDAPLTVYAFAGGRAGGAFASV